MKKEVAFRGGALCVSLKSHCTLLYYCRRIPFHPFFFFFSFLFFSRPGREYLATVRVCYWDARTCWPVFLNGAYTCTYECVCLFVSYIQSDILLGFFFFFLFGNLNFSVNTAMQFASFLKTVFFILMRKAPGETTASTLDLKR